ncbi:MAG: TonB-dependent receptor [Bacteroidales bacterium]|jgi:hypothetical protein|nr:TonB-dependent receptor [Bacteroidales bacterium]
MNFTSSQYLFKIVNNPKYLCLFILLSVIFNINIQAQGKKNCALRGKLVTPNNQPVEYATIVVKSLPDSAIVTGSISDDKGNFVVDKLKRGNYSLSISAMGYKPLNMSGITLLNNSKKDLGKMIIEIDVKAIDEVVVIGDNKMVELRPDKKIVRIDKAIAVSGGSAADALEIVPEIRVEGRKISLKGQSFRVLINGRPSGMTSDQLFDIPASNIKKIEVITNPSVKYSPEGLGGIVNVILVKSRLGLNGLIQASGGTDNCYNGAFTINYNTKRFNTFATANMNYFGGKSEGYIDRTVYKSNHLRQDYTGDQNFIRYNMKVGFDYDIDSTNLITLFWGQPNDKANNEKDILSKTSYPSISNSQKYDISRESDMQRNDLSFLYTHLFKKEGTKLELDVLQSFYNYSKTYSEFSVNTENSNDKYRFKQTPDKEYTKTTIKLDFEYPVSKKVKFESGVNIGIVNRDDSNSGATFNYNKNIWADSTSIRNTFNYEENKYGGYILFSYRNKKLRFKGGLRAEYFDTKNGLDNSTNKVNNNYFNLFPSISISYAINDINDIGFSYSRRIKKPTPFHLNPFIYNGDFTSEQLTGNQYLKPAYNNSFELNVSQNWKKVSINTSLSYTYGKDMIDKVYYITNDNITIRNWDNIADVHSLYGSISLNWRTTQWCKMYLSGNVEKVFIDHDNKPQKDYFDYNIRYSSRIYLPHDWSLSLLLLYYAPINYYSSRVDGGFRLYLTATKRVSDRLYFSIKLNDLFNQKYVVKSWSDQFTSKSYTNNFRRSIYIGFMYKFGKRIKNRSRTYLNTRLKMNR